MARAGLFLLVLLLALPSANYQVFDGLPVSHGAEFVSFVLLIPFLASRALRRLYARWVDRWPRAVRRAPVAAALLALGIKLVLLASGTYQGFPACYRSPFAPPVTGACERSFENSFLRFGVTRIDAAISFEPRDWDLSFLNSIRLVTRPYRGPLRWQMPLEATWGGVVERAEPWVARITYRGEGQVTLEPSHPGAAATAVRLAPQYGASTTVLVPVPSGRHTLRVEYRFDDGSRWGGPNPTGPWATLHVERGRGPDGREPGAPVSARRPAWPWQALARAGDGIVVALAVPLLLFYTGLLWRNAWLLGLVGIATPLVDRVDPARLGLPTSLGLCLLLVLVAVPVLGRPWRRRLVGAYFGMLYVTWFATLRTFPRLDVVTLRDAWEDPVRYESHARSILETWSLQGGEPIFYFQPGFRYVRFLERLVFGDGDGLLSIVALTALYWAICWSCARLWARPRPAGPRPVAFLSVAVLVLALVSSRPVVRMIQFPLSEYPAWIALPLSFPMLLVSRSARAWRLGGFLLGLAGLMRLNHIPAVAALMTVSVWRTRRRAALVAAGLMLAVLMLPAAHNVFYGGRLVWTTDSASVIHNYVLPPAALLKLPTDAGVRYQLRYQLDFILYIHTVHNSFQWFAEHVSWVAIRGIQLMWLAVGALTLWQRDVPRITKVLLGMPVVYLVVHLFYAVDSYFPRHVVAPYLAMALTTLHAVGRGWRAT